MYYYYYYYYYYHYIQARDTAGNNMRTNSDVFQARWNGPETISIVTRPVNPDAMDGLYKVEYIISKAGRYTLAISFAGRPIMDSPWVFDARPGLVSPEHSTTHKVVDEDGRFGPGDGVLSFVAGTRARFVVQARDAYGNKMDEETSNITAAIEWEHYTTSTVMPVLDDTELNTDQYGSYFYGSPTYLGGGRYMVEYTALRQGLHSFFIKINEENVQGSPFALAGSSAVEPYGPKSLCEQGSPPESVVAGETIAFQVQLRDAFGNLLDASPPDVLAIAVTAPPPTTSRDEGSCVAVPGHNGLFDCTVVPTVSGDRLMSVQVGGIEISKLVSEPPLWRVSAVKGPWAIYVAPARVLPATTMVYGIRESYVAGFYKDALVQLRDRFGNNLTSSENRLNFGARFGANQLQFLDHDDGTITVSVGKSLAGLHTIDITLDGVHVGNSPTPLIQTHSTEARFDGTLCHVPPEIIAGVNFIFQCDPRDTFGNDVNDNDLFLELEFKNMDEVTAPLVTVRGHYDPIGGGLMNRYDYNFNLEILRQGAYSVVGQLWAKGGLIAQYYRTPGFQSLIATYTDRQHQGEGLIEYTQVDPNIDFFWTDSPVATCPEDYWSVAWYGFLLPKASGIHTLRVEADRGVKVLVGDDWVIDYLESEIAVRATAQVSLVDHEPMRIQVQYSHGAGSAYVRLYWASTVFEEEKIPSQYLLYPLNALSGDTTTVVIRGI